MPSTHANLAFPSLPSNFSCLKSLAVQGSQTAIGLLQVFGRSCGSCVARIGRLRFPLSMMVQAHLTYLLATSQKAYSSAWRAIYYYSTASPHASLDSSPPYSVKYCNCCLYREWPGRYLLDWLAEGCRLASASSEPSASLECFNRASQERRIDQPVDQSSPLSY